MMKRSQLVLSAVLIAFGTAPLPAAEPARVEIKVATDHIVFLSGKDLVTRYHTGSESGELAKPYFWPVYAVGGIPVTRAWPMEKGQPDETTDHVHQKSVWFAHGEVIAEGLPVKNSAEQPKPAKGKAKPKEEGIDFWSEAKGHGRIVCTKVGSAQVEGNRGWVPTQNEWRAADGTKVMDEKRTIHFYDFGDTRLLVLDIDLHASVMPITFGDTKEGAMGIRINDLIRAQTGRGTIENADGKIGEAACWGRLSAWCDYSGPINGQTVGIAILDDPTNRYPACWHSRAYGLMAANPFGRGKSGFPAMRGRTDLVKLAKGEHLQLRYGVLIHPGNAKDGKVADYFQKFVKLKG